MSERPRPNVDLYNVSTLAIHIAESFAKVAPREGVRLEGNEAAEDANVAVIFWSEVAREILLHIPGSPLYPSVEQDQVKK